ncbi:hypothetical protein XELAEV_18035326mg [Xenopus laevis]|uniref:Uncharacterized protein n=1 Tax=Xenopus laevis TaxID=8355 RepID=A0A974CGM4_XENLA|nr:hypothetical protein XELAEV_18035326mg [Xenopus laevis]
MLPQIGREDCLATHMKAYEAQQNHIEQVLEALLSQMPSVSPVTGNPPTEVAPPTVSSAGEPHIPPPPRYNRDPQDCRRFLTHCLIQFEF